MQFYQQCTGGFFKNFCTVRGAQSRLLNFDHLYTLKSVIFDASLYKIAAKTTRVFLFCFVWFFWPNFPKRTHVLQMGRIGS